MDAITDLLSILKRQNDLVEQFATGQKSLADKNIIKSDNSTLGGKDVPSNLKSNEKKRVGEISSIFIKKFFEEQKKSTKDTALKTKTAKLGGGGMAKGLGVKLPNPKEETKSLWDKIKGWAFLLGAAFIALGKNIGKVLGWLWGGIKKVWQFIKPFLKKFIGWLWKGVKFLANKIWSGVKYVAGKVWGYLRGIWGKIVKTVSGFISKLKSLIVVGAKKLFKSISEKISSIVESIKNSKAYKFFAETIDNVKNLISDVFTNIKNKIVEVVSKAKDFIKNLIPKPIQAAFGKAKSIATKAGKAIVDTTVKVGKSVGGAAVKSAKVVGGAAVKSAKVVGGAVVKGAKAVAGWTASAAKKVVKGAASKGIKAVGGMGKMMAKLTAKGASKIPIIGPLIESVLAGYDIKNMKEKFAKGEITKEELQQQAGRRVITGITGGLGGVGGAVLAGALGSVIPVAGTALGAIAGGILGDVAGRFLGGVITDYIIPKKYTKTIGAFVTNTAPPKAEMQDFIIKDGRVTPFSHKDEIMGLKQGGAINEFLKGGGGNGSMSILKRLYSVNVLANKYLEAIAQNTAKMANSNSHGSSGKSQVIVTPQPQQSKSPKTPSAQVGNNRQGYANSSYSLI